MKMQIKDIINKHYNNPAIIIGHGNSYNRYLDKMSLYKNKGYILIDCNNWYDFGSPPTEPNYWVISNTVFTIQNKINDLNRYNIPICYADCVDLTNRDWIDKNLKCSYLPYDNKHFESKTKYPWCNGKCCGHMIQGRLTIQEELQKYTNYPKHYGQGGSVILYSISFAILMGCNPIYITGMDLNYKVGYAKSNKNLSIANDRTFDICQKGLMDDLDIINKSAKNKGIELINVNPNSNFDVIKLGSIKE